MTQPTTTGETPKPEASETQVTPTESKPTLEQIQAELESAQKRIKELNSENAKHRKAAEAAQKAIEDKAASELSETEKLKKVADDALKAKADTETRLKATLIRADIISRASALNFADPADAINFIDKEKLTIGDDGSVTGTEEALKDLVKAKPYLLKKATTPSGNPTNAGGNGTQTGETIEQQRARIYGTGRSVFDQSYAAQMGGGVVVAGLKDKG